MQWKADAPALTGPGTKVELGQLSDEEVFDLAGRLLQLDLSAQPKAEPGIIIRRGDKGWRIAAHQGRLRMYHTTSPLDDFWTVNGPEELATLPPFQASAASSARAGGKYVEAPTRSGKKTASTVLEAVGLIGAGVVLMAVGVWFGTPHRKLSDVPADVTLLSPLEDRQGVFSAVAGTYSTGRKTGDKVLVVDPDGHVSIGVIGKDGKPILPPRREEQARAGRRQDTACVVTSFGIIAATPPPDVSMGAMKWRRVNTN
jgi:hypothetical protein